MQAVVLWKYINAAAPFYKGSSGFQPQVRLPGDAKKLFQRCCMQKYTITDWSEFSPPAYLSNGFIGFRIGKNPFAGIGGFLSGFTGMSERSGVSAICAIPTPVYQFTIDGGAAEVNSISQTYDFATAEFTTTAELKTESAVVTVENTVFCSRTSPTLLMSELKLTSEEPHKVGCRLSYAVQPEMKFTVGETVYSPAGSQDYHGKAIVYSKDHESKMGMAYRVFGESAVIDSVSEDNVQFSTETSAEPAVLHVITSYIPGVLHSEPHNQAHRMLKLAAWNGFDRLRTQNRRAWEKIWESRITVEGTMKSEWQEAIDASLFYLMCSASPFSAESIGPYGLSTDGYEGHCFWDTESFMFMMPMLCAPDIAESMLEYRFDRIGAAANNAKINGYRGIQFPWQSGTTGDEVTVPWAGQAGGAGEQHVNLDVALAFDGYARVSGDIEFVRERAWPVIRGVARWIESRVELTARGYEILHVTGIDEESDDVNNDSYTNLMARQLLRAANEYSVLLGLGRRDHWLEIADHMFIPSREDHVLPQYEGAPDKPSQPSTVLMSYFPYGYSDTDENDVATYRYYIDHDMRRYLNYPMLSGFLGIFPAWCGNRREALEFYEWANLTFFCEPFHASAEWSITDPAERIKPTRFIGTTFVTARGSFLSGLVMGLTKICPWRAAFGESPEYWLGKDIVLPEGWERLTIGKMYIHGRAYRAIAENGAEHTILEPID